MSLTIQHLTLEMSGKRELRLAALEGEKLVGVANVGGYGKIASTIFQLFVVPDSRGRGVGTALVREACSMAKADGAIAMSAFIEPGGPPGFWAANGFKPAHVDGINLLVVRQFNSEEG